MNERAAAVVSSVDRPPPPVPDLESGLSSRNRNIGVAVLEVLVVAVIVWSEVLPAIHHGDWFRILFWGALTVNYVVAAGKRVRRVRARPVAGDDPLTVGNEYLGEGRRDSIIPLLPDSPLGATIAGGAGGAAGGLIVGILTGGVVGWVVGLAMGGAVFGYGRHKLREWGNDPA